MKTTFKPLTRNQVVDAVLAGFLVSTGLALGGFGWFAAAAFFAADAAVSLARS